MNYRHIFHAGGFADIFKHLLLITVLDYLQRKDKPCLFIDTHAGTGLYDLQSEQALKTGESTGGISKLLAATNHPPEITRFIAQARKAVAGNRMDLKRFYPGSPLIMKSMLRKADRLVANELHPDDNRTLKKTLGSDSRIRVEQTDGYGLLKALLPPAERRGLVLIDPPFEVRDEFTRMEKAMKHALKRWATGIYLLWYPIKDIKITESFQNNFSNKTENSIAVDFFIQKPTDTLKLNGCGVVIVNPPWTLEEQLNHVLPWLSQTLTDGQGHFNIRSL